MIRKFETKDLLEVMELWLSANIQAQLINTIDQGVEKFVSAIIKHL
ncbi:MAG: hypothetical protein L6276_07460 [Acetobacterium sp.]|nr:hypothetical protein [Acetobacterium sp.]